MLRALEEASLLDRDPAGRYSMHDLIADYAVETARQLDERVRRSALRRVVDFYLHTAHTADRLLRPQPRTSSSTHRHPASTSTGCPTPARRCPGSTPNTTTCSQPSAPPWPPPISCPTRRPDPRPPLRQPRPHRPRAARRGDRASGPRPHAGRAAPRQPATGPHPLQPGARVGAAGGVRQVRGARRSRRAPLPRSRPAGVGGARAQQRGLVHRPARRPRRRSGALPYRSRPQPEPARRRRRGGHPRQPRLHRPPHRPPPRGR
ncbi:hypothetical protein NKH77_07910 [Streptomyces sp. M19]